MLRTHTETPIRTEAIANDRADVQSSRSAFNSTMSITTALAHPSVSAQAAETTTPERIARRLGRVAQRVALERRIVHAGDLLYQAGTPFGTLYVINSGRFKVVNISREGLSQVVDLQWRGNWLGLEGLASGTHGCDVRALDSGEVWALRYGDVLRAGMTDVALLHDLHAEMGRALSRGHHAVRSRNMRDAKARVADFLFQWAESLASIGQRTDQFSLSLSRGDMANYLGMTLESVCRALTSLARRGVIAFIERGRRVISIPDLHALHRCAQAEGTVNVA